MALATEVRGLTVGISAHVSKPGYVPFTPVLSKNAVSRLFVLWPDKAQLAVLDESESNYHRVQIDHNNVSITLPSGENLSHFYTYISRHGHVIDDSKNPIFAPDAISSDLPIGSQNYILRVLLLCDNSLSNSTLSHHPTEFTEKARRDPELRDQVRRILQERATMGQLATELIGQSGGTEENLARPPATTYESMPPANRIEHGTFRVVPSADNFNRRGESTVRVSPEVADILGTQHVLVSIAQLGGVEGATIKTLSRVRRHGDLNGHEIIEVDQVVRNSIGAEVGEDVHLLPVHLRRARVLDWLAGRPSYVTCRVQAADSATVEREVCLVDGLTLNLLGIQAGDEVVLEGVNDDFDCINQARMKAFQTSDVIQQCRERLHGGDFSCRFPSSLDALAVFPDLPWVFLDSSTRNALGLGSQKLSTVRIRPSRRYQMRKELRELLLLIGVAFIGLISILTDTKARIFSLGALVIFVAAVVIMRLRGRLKHELHQPRQQRLEKWRRRKT